MKFSTMLSEIDVLFTLIARVIKFLDEGKIEKQVRELVQQLSPYQLEQFLQHCGVTGTNIAGNQKDVKKVYILYLPLNTKRTHYQDEGQLMVFHCEDKEKKGGLAKVCYTCAELDRELACVRREE